MAVAYIQEFPITNRSTATFDFVAEKIGDGPFDGLIAHSAGFDDEAGVFRILDIWESQEHAQRFLDEHVQPLVDQGPDAFPNPDNFTQPTRDGFYEAPPRREPGRCSRDLLVGHTDLVPRSALRWTREKVGRAVSGHGSAEERVQIIPGACHGSSPRALVRARRGPGS